MNFHSPKWLSRYVKFRLINRLEFWDEMIAINERTVIDSSDIDLVQRNNVFYQTLRHSGVLFGCPLMEATLIEQFSELKFLSVKDQATFLNIEVLFITLMREIAILVPDLGSYQDYLSRTLIRIVQFYLGEDVDRQCFGLETEELLKNRNFSKMISRVESIFSDRIRIRGKFTFANSIQNNVAFLDIYSMINWNRRFHNQTSAPIQFLAEIHRKTVAVQKQIVLIFAGLVWYLEQELALKSSDYWENNPAQEEQQDLLKPGKKKMLTRYIKTSKLHSNDKKELLRAVKKTVYLKDIKYEKSAFILNRYLLEQTILLSLIDEEGDPFRIPFIQQLGELLGMTEVELKAGVTSVADFFHSNEERFDFIRGNRALHHIKKRANKQVSLAVKKNLGRIMNEIRQTGKLYGLLVKSSAIALTKEEKAFVKEQLLSIIKAIPALAIFCLPAGAMVLPIFIKILPFNMLPNSFVD